MAHIERRLGLPAGGGTTVEARFAAMQRGLLARQWKELELGDGHPTPDATGTGYFAAQAAAIAAIRRELERRYGPLEADAARIQHAVRRAIRERADADPEGVRRDRSRLYELTRLMGFTPELYDRPALAQEEIAETLKRTRATLMLRGRRDSIHNLIPIAVGPRVVHVRVPEPLLVDALDAIGDGVLERMSLLADLHGRMQRTLDGLCEELEPLVAPHRRPNPLYSGTRS
jgi:hypothetical protein